jgi:hypothetical protein
MGYATLTDMQNFGVPAGAFGQLSNVQIQAQLDFASGQFDSAGRARYSFPLVSVPIEVIGHIVSYAAFRCMVLRGWDPNNPGDVAMRDLWIAADEYFKRVQRGWEHPAVVESPAPTNQTQPSYSAPMVVGQPLLGWMPGQCPPPVPGSPLPAGSGFPNGSPWPPNGWPDSGSNPPPGVF